MNLSSQGELSATSKASTSEEYISKKKAMEIFEQHLLKTSEIGTFKGLAMIHQHLFDEIFPFAGQIRSVNISKGNFRFASVLYLKDALAQIDSMPQSTFDEIIEKYVEMNVAHPFREGNGRSMRLWLDAMLKQALGRVVDWSRVDRTDYLLAMERSPVRDTEIKMLLKGALTDEVEDRLVFMQGLDASYRYEGFEAVRTQDIFAEDSR